MDWYKISEKILKNVVKTQKTLENLLEKWLNVNGML